MVGAEDWGSMVGVVEFFVLSDRAVEIKRTPAGGSLRVGVSSSVTTATFPDKNNGRARRNDKCSKKRRRPAKAVGVRSQSQGRRYVMYLSWLDYEITELQGSTV